jgi:YVTN family beta-propeller protein
MVMSARRSWGTTIGLLMLVTAGRRAPAEAAPLAYVADAAGDTVSVIDTERNEVVSRIPVGNAPGAVVTPDGTRVYVVDSAVPPTLSVIDTAANAVLAAVPLTAGGFMAASTTRLYVNDGAALLVIDRATNALLTTIPLGCNPLGVAVNPDGTRVYVADCEGGAGCSACSGRAEVQVIDATNNTVLAPIPVDPIRGFISGVAVSPDGTRVYVANHCQTTPPPSTPCSSGALVTIDAGTNAVMGSGVPIDPTPSFLVVAPSGGRVYVAHFKETDSTELPGSVTVVDVTTNMVKATIPVGRFPLGIDVSPAGTAVYVPNRDDGNVSVLDTATNTVTTITVGGTPSAPNRFISPEDTGTVPADKSSLKCGNAAAKNAVKLLRAIIRCHMKAAKKALAKAAFDEDGCETAAKARFDDASTKLTGCAACVADNAPGLRDLLESFLDRANGDMYCGGTRALAP